jgi:3D (Asp-Asp-Asp) domain-containing protein
MSVAADNSLFKFGTRMIIHHPTKGNIPVVVRDTGSAIVGNRLDLFVGKLDQRVAFSWGAQRLEVTIYD